MYGLSGTALYAPLRIMLAGADAFAYQPGIFKSFRVGAKAGVAFLNIDSAQAPFATHPFFAGGGLGWDFYLTQKVTLGVDGELMVVSAGSATNTFSNDQGNGLTVVTTQTSRAGAFSLAQLWFALKVWF